MVDTKPKLINWQAPMMHVLWALLPSVVFSIYLFGWRVFWLLLLANAAAFGVEFAFTRRWKEPVSAAVFVSATLFVMSLPPGLPAWMTVVGIVFGIFFGKMVFGGFGRNIFNPALTGRAFVYISFGGYMTAQWAHPFSGLPGGFAHWFNSAADAVTQATPGMLIKHGNTVSLIDELLGRTPGVIGGTCIPLVVLGGLYILYRKAANYRIVVSGVLGFLIMQSLLWLGGVKGAAEPVHSLFAGSFLFGIFFYATDPVSACQTQAGRWLYGAFVGILSCLISTFSVWPAGTMFAILLANMFGPITDHLIKLSQQKPAAAPPGEKPA